MPVDTRMLRSPTPAGRGPVAWLKSGALSVQLLAVGTGCTFATMLPRGLLYRVLAIVIPLIFVMAARPEIQQAVRVRCGRRARSWRKGQPAARSAISRPHPSAGGTTSTKPVRTDNSSSEALFLRSFDRLEEILQEALTLEIGEIAKEFTLQEKVGHLEETGFLTAANRADWADCLAVRRSLLLAVPDVSGPASDAVEGALAKMLQLQITFTDRRRVLFDKEQLIGRQEDGELRRVAARIN